MRASVGGMGARSQSNLLWPAVSVGTPDRPLATVRMVTVGLCRGRVLGEGLLHVPIKIIPCPPSDKVTAISKPLACTCVETPALWPWNDLETQERA